MNFIAATFDKFYKFLTNSQSSDNKNAIILAGCVCVCVRSLSCVPLFVTLWTVAHQAPLSTGFSRQEYWSGLPFPPPGDLPNPGIKPASPVSPALQADSLPLSQRGSSAWCLWRVNYSWYVFTVKNNSLLLFCFFISPGHRAGHCKILCNVLFLTYF